MQKTITKAEFIKAESKMEQLLAKATERGGFENLTHKENEQLAEYTEIVKAYEAENITIPMPNTISGLLQLKMYENQLKQKDMAKLLKTSDTQLSEIIHEKRKPTLNFLKSINQKLGVDGNLLLQMV